MLRKNLGLFITLGVVLILFGMGCSSYNGLVTADQSVKKSWGNVETNYQRRVDLYNQIIDIIESSQKFEKSTLIDVQNARSKATEIKVDINDPASLAKFQAAQGQLQSSFTKLMAVAEAYPDLKTTKQFENFQTQAEETENRINIARRDFNAAVDVYNTSTKIFPRNIFANMFGFKEKSYYQSDPGSDKRPTRKIGN
jgi:LemA protein